MKETKATLVLLTLVLASGAGAQGEPFDALIRP